MVRLSNHDIRTGRISFGRYTLAFALWGKYKICSRLILLCIFICAAASCATLNIHFYEKHTDPCLAYSR